MKEYTTQLGGLLTKDGLRRTLAGKNNCAAEMFFLLVASCSVKDVAFEAKCDLITVNV